MAQQSLTPGELLALSMIEAGDCLCADSIRYGAFLRENARYHHQAHLVVKTANGPTFELPPSNTILIIMASNYQTIIFDMGEVLFSWTPTDHPSVPVSTLVSMIRHDLWPSFERGELSAEQVYQTLGEEFSISAAEIAAAFGMATAALKPNDQMTALVQDIKRHCTGTPIVMMTNIPRPDFDKLRETEYIWESFDQVFASCHEGMRKPESRFYQRVLDSVGVSEPTRAILVDDRLENVTAAQELGMQAVHCTDVEATCQKLRDILGI